MISPRAALTDAAALEQHVAQHYDDLDKWYRVVWGEHVHHGLWREGNESQSEAVQKLTTFLADALDIKANERVCDVGCGYGGTARILASKYRAQVDRYTLSEKQYAFAQERLNGKSNPKYHLKNWLANDIEDASRDVAIGIESSEHFDDKGAMIQEMHRVLKPGGRLGLYTWLACPSPTEWQRKHLLEAICAEGRLPNLGDESDYRRWLEDAGFTGIHYENLTRQVRKTMPLIVLRIMRRLTWDLSGWRHLLFGPNKVFAKTIVRITWAYYTGAMEYGIFTARKPDTA